jgi:hypothetical protein
MPFPVDVAWVEATQGKLGVTFPLGFVARMLRENGGEIHAGGDVWELFPFRDGSDKKRIKRTCNDIVLETKNARLWPDFPPNGVAIGTNGTGDRLILVPTASDAGRLHDCVYWWDHETGGLERVADDFTELTGRDHRR